MLPSSGMTTGTEPHYNNSKKKGFRRKGTVDSLTSCTTTNILRRSSSRRARIHSTTSLFDDMVVIASEQQPHDFNNQGEEEKDKGSLQKPSFIEEGNVSDIINQGNKRTVTKRTNAQRTNKKRTINTTESTEIITSVQHIILKEKKGRKQKKMKVDDETNEKKKSVKRITRSSSAVLLVANFTIVPAQPETDQRQNESIVPSNTRKKSRTRDHDTQQEPETGMLDVGTEKQKRKPQQVKSSMAIANQQEESVKSSSIATTKKISRSTRTAKSSVGNEDGVVIQKSIKSETIALSKKAKRRNDDLQENEDIIDQQPKAKQGLILSCLPRTQEEQILHEPTSRYKYVMGIDEAGRGPLCGPVVAAAVILPPPNIMGITDSKKIVQEDKREQLYEQILSTPGVRWSVAIMDASTIDEINILQATLRGMTWAAESILEWKKSPHRRPLANISELGCYVVCGRTDETGKRIELNINDEQQGEVQQLDKSLVYALVDGNKFPILMPCDGASIVKGDSKEYCIAAASIIAKVTRDRLMNAYDVQYPSYNLKCNKGYPTKAHMEAIDKYGACSIHRRSFAPLKHMNLDRDRKII